MQKNAIAYGTLKSRMQSGSNEAACCTLEGIKGSAFDRSYSQGNNGRLFHDQIILYCFHPLDALCDLICLIDGLPGIDEAAQLNGALVRFDTDLK